MLSAPFSNLGTYFCFVFHSLFNLLSTTKHIYIERCRWCKAIIKIKTEKKNISQHQYQFTGFKCSMQLKSIFIMNRNLLQNYAYVNANVNCTRNPNPAQTTCKHNTATHCHTKYAFCPFYGVRKEYIDLSDIMRLFSDILFIW